MDRCDIFYPDSEKNDKNTRDIGTLDNQFSQLEQRLGYCSSPKQVALAMRFEFQDHVAFHKRRGTDESQLVDRYAEIIRQLPEAEALVLALFYHEGLNFEEIAEVLNLGESEVCQIFSHAIIMLCADFPWA